jgi:predicted transcriptional regulator
MVSDSLSDKASRTIMTPELHDFLHQKVNSFVKWDLVRFFHDNPHTKDTVENLARYIGRDVKTIERELQSLAGADVLKREEISGLDIYELGEDESVRQLIAEFIEACHDRAFRVEAIHYVIKEMQFSPRHDF